MADSVFDAIVIGAGPAGSTAACLLARAGARTLLVERQAFPRAKVCGGCLNAQALAAMDRAGLGDRVRGLGARQTSVVRVHQGGRAASLALPPGLAVSRAALDAALAGAAVDAGATFITETTALLVDEGPTPAHDGWRRVSLQPRGAEAASAQTRLVLVADGLSHSSLRECAALRSRPARRARVGVGGLGPPGIVETQSGAITMAVGRHGYVGAVEVEEGRINVAAAFDPGFLRRHESPGAAVTSVLSEAGVAFDGRVAGIAWGGTIPLTRRMPRPAARRVFVLGDAAGYVEPFTGEGMAWALAAAELVVPLALSGIAGWHEGLEREWVALYGSRIGREQRWCRLVALVLRQPALVAPLVMLLQRRPGFARPVLAHLRPRASRS
jgi:menaquinone-9 beta-reductase